MKIIVTIRTIIAIGAFTTLIFHGATEPRTEMIKALHRIFEQVTLGNEFTLSTTQAGVTMGSKSSMSQKQTILRWKSRLSR